MPKLALVFALLLVAALPASAAAKVRKGPAGTAFYTPPSHLSGKSHGGLIWARRLTGAAALRGGSANKLLLYRSRSANGKTAAVSGTLTLPKGHAPKGGWPVITYAHGTTGIADVCAPSRDSASNAAHGLNAYAYPLLRRWVKAGYAVVRTDYAGLGTPGVHPFLNGHAEGYSVLDAVRAARKLDKRIGRRVVIAGHSQGGQSALWAASLARRWTPELKLRGTLALAPVSHLGEQAALLRSLKSPGALSGFAAMILRGLDVARPALGVSSDLSARAAALYPQTLTECLPHLQSADSFGGMAPADIVRSDADLTPIVKALSVEDDPEDLKVPTSVRIQQGTADATVFQTFTDQLADSYHERGVRLVYKTYQGVSHGGAVTDPTSAKDATKYIRSRLG